jgi:Polyketide cyclase / dehydrase and lipid transport
MRVTRAASFLLPLSAEEAIELFTPEGERRWAGIHWDPVYPDAGTRGDPAPGLVFTTAGDGGTTVWVVLAREPDRITYARVLPDHSAGIVTVTCSPTADESSQVTVQYDITALGDAGEAFASSLADHYDAFIESWRDEIVNSLDVG